MKFIVKLSPEITIKTRPVRKQFVARLQANIRKICRRRELGGDMVRRWDMLEVVLDPQHEESCAAHQQRCSNVAQVLRTTPGIAHFLEVAEHNLDLSGSGDEILERIARAAGAVYAAQLPGHSYAVRCKRHGEHDFNSQRVEEYVGAWLGQRCDNNGVDLHHADITVALEIKRERLFIVKQRHAGLGGLPLGCVGQVLSLISGGYDSSVASYQTIRRGMETHFCFFNLGGHAHEVGVRQVAHFLWDRYASSHRTAFISVNFEPVVEEILHKVAKPYMGVVLKRMMLRAASQVAAQMKIDALVTGEAIAQVSSQTIANLALIDKVSDVMVMRPLISSDKTAIIARAVEAGVATYAEHMPEYCAVISDKPTTAAKPRVLEQQEEKFDFTILQNVVEQRTMCGIDDVYEKDSIIDEVEKQSVPEPGQVIIDLRDEDSCANKPLKLHTNKTLNIPFYKLNRLFSELDSEQQYLLYCDRGAMSRLHAAHLRAEGYANVKVYQPKAQ
ncbi:MAG: tRNA 4-thiouridine(8) synthase ThiI [Pseudomonadales bacterium]|nr:tRNA 4-thiouridine(8) synthase ThiI [Pseudomonadales bacterium]